MSYVKPQTRVFIIDDHPLIRQSVVAILSHETEFAVCGEAEDTSAALDLIDSLKPDIVLLDLQLKSGIGIEGVRQIKEKVPKTKVLVFSGHDEFVYSPRVVRVGASGYICKNEPTEKFLLALRKVANGGIYLSAEIEKQLLKDFAAGKPTLARSPVELLSNRELQIFTLCGQGIPRRAIAEQLNISIKTVESHRENIKEKLNIKNSAELLQRAVEWRRNPSAG